MLIHLRLAHPLVGDRDEVFEIIQLHLFKSPHAKQFGEEIVFDMVILHGLESDD